MGGPKPNDTTIVGAVVGPPPIAPLPPVAPAPIPLATGDRLITLGLWKSCQVKPGFLHEFEAIADKIMFFKAIYEKITAKTGIPFHLIGALDSREESFNHHGYLGNGDPWNRPSTHVPAGRGPFASWEDGAVDALTFDGLNKVPHWDIVTALLKCEAYNGMGYHRRGLPSPYVWAGTNIQKPGKYTGDGRFDPNAMDTQPGCAGIFLTLKQKYGVDLIES